MRPPRKCRKDAADRIKLLYEKFAPIKRNEKLYKNFTLKERQSYCISKWSLLKAVNIPSVTAVINAENAQYWICIRGIIVV